MPGEEASVILDNWTQIALGEAEKAVEREAGLQALALLSAQEILIDPWGCPISPFCSPISRFPLFFWFCQRLNA